MPAHSGFWCIWCMNSSSWLVTIELHASILGLSKSSLDICCFKLLRFLLNSAKCFILAAFLLKRIRTSVKIVFISLKKATFSVICGRSSFILNQMYLGKKSWSVIKTPSPTDVMLWIAESGLLLEPVWLSSEIDSSILRRTSNTLSWQKSGSELSLI